MGVAFDCTPEKVERGGDPLPLRWKTEGDGTQVQIVRRQIIGRTIRRSSDLGLQGRLNYTRDGYRYFVLKLEDVFERTVESVGPEMCTGRSIDQLPGNPNLLTAFLTEPSST
jgi:hypothetical protein